MEEVIGKKTILQDIIQDIKTARVHSISSDELIRWDEFLAICFRNIYKEKSIQENFMKFIYLERLSQEHIAEKILHRDRNKSKEI